MTRRDFGYGVLTSVVASALWAAASSVSSPVAARMKEIAATWDYAGLAGLVVFVALVMLWPGISWGIGLVLLSFGAATSIIAAQEHAFGTRDHLVQWIAASMVVIVPALGVQAVLGFFWKRMDAQISRVFDTLAATGGQMSTDEIARTTGLTVDSVETICSHSDFAERCGSDPVFLWQLSPKGQKRAARLSQ